MISAPKKALIVIVVACILIALAIFLSLAYDKRKWIESCVSGNELFSKEQTVQICELQYVKSQK
ncbi:hypothetical protein LT85_3281 [Collimonas arenae]|uniref:Uncharacterized protein n=1 Tax=Collimonas arenae TaxID=279058 RepID=A0A0A1FFJ0_9BURK|nr:hypothetical protein LT85_3281 [Collimonas arenae]